VCLNCAQCKYNNSVLNNLISVYNLIEEIKKPPFDGERACPNKEGGPRTPIEYSIRYERDEEAIQHREEYGRSEIRW